MPDKARLRQLIRENLDAIADGINAALRGENLQKMETVLSRVGRGNRIPHWYEILQADGTLPNLDGKTIGSVIEMLLVCVLETGTFGGEHFPTQKINPARGVDLPDLELGIKSPSENYCTSEPFFSAYERLLGSEYDIIILLTDYQVAKKNPPLKLQLIKSRYLTNTQVADKKLCDLARTNRGWLLAENESWAKKLFRFLAYVNQSDWRARQLLKTIPVMRDSKALSTVLSKAERDFTKKNTKATTKDKALIPDSDLEALLNIKTITPTHAAVIDALDTWVLDTLKDIGRPPNDNEWNRLKTGPLDGKIGMSFALQWRYNFAGLFR